MTDYNGWTNRETWAVMLHINNDQGLQEKALAIARECLEDDTTYEFELAIQDWVSELLDFDYWVDTFDAPMPRGIVAMLQDVGSLWRVNWREAAESLLEDLRQ